MAAQPAKTVTVAALAGAAFAVAYKATTKYLSNDEDETPKSLDDSTKLDESTASSSDQSQSQNASTLAVASCIEAPWREMPLARASTANLRAARL